MLSSNSEWTCRSAAMSLVLAEQCGQRPEKVFVDLDNENTPYTLQRRLDPWSTSTMQRCYRVGFQIIPLLAESEPFSVSAEDAVMDSWNALHEEHLVENELWDETSDEFAEVVSLSDRIVTLLDENNEAIESIANTLATKQQLKYREIDDVLKKHGLLF